MKEFERYLNTEKENSILTRRELWSESQIEEAERIWKAALGWAENLFVQLNSFEVEETINKELREE